MYLTELFLNRETHRLIRKQLRRRLSTSQLPSHLSTSRSNGPRATVGDTRSHAAQALLCIWNILPHQLPRQRQDPRTHSRARTRPGARRSRLIGSPRRHERGGGGREAQGGDPEARPAAARWLLQGTPFPVWLSSPREPPQIWATRVAAFPFSCAVLPSPGWPAPGFLPFSRCLGQCAVWSAQTSHPAWSCDGRSSRPMERPLPTWWTLRGHLVAPLMGNI